MFAAADDALWSNLELLRSSEGNQLISDSNAKSWEVVTGSFGPLKVNLSKARELFGGAGVSLERFHVTTEGSIDAVLRD